ncbi:MAG: MMPL family transporter [Streptosporangiaceae bacterium]
MAGLAVLAAGCLGLLSIRTTSDPLSDLKGSPGSVVGARLLAAHYPAGTIAPLDLLAEPAHAAAAAVTARAAPGVAAVSPTAPVESYDSFLITLSVPPYGPQAGRTIASLRLHLEQAASGSLLGGDPAIQYDIGQAAARDAALLVPLILLLVLVVIAVLLRAVIAPLVLAVTTGLSFAASFGLSNLLWRYSLGYPGFASQLPLSVTGAVITAAGVVLAATFAALAQLPSVSLTEVGTAVALGVLLDTLVVRTVIVPALLLWIGDRIWWPAGPVSG